MTQQKASPKTVAKQPSARVLPATRDQVSPGRTNAQRKLRQHTQELERSIQVLRNRLKRSFLLALLTSVSFFLGRYVFFVEVAAIAELRPALNVLAVMLLAWAAFTLCMLGVAR